MFALCRQDKLLISSFWALIRHNHPYLVYLWRFKGLFVLHYRYRTTSICQVLVIKRYVSQLSSWEYECDTKIFVKLDGYKCLSKLKFSAQSIQAYTPCSHRARQVCESDIQRWNTKARFRATGRMCFVQERVEVVVWGIDHNHCTLYTVCEVRKISTHCMLYALGCCVGDFNMTENGSSNTVRTWCCVNLTRTTWGNSSIEAHHQYAMPYILLTMHCSVCSLLICPR